MKNAFIEPQIRTMWYKYYISKIQKILVIAHNMNIKDDNKLASKIGIPIQHFIQPSEMYSGNVNKNKMEVRKEVAIRTKGVETITLDFKGSPPLFRN